MASIYKRSRDQRRKGSYWYIAFCDHAGSRRTVRGYTDKAETERLAARLENDARLVRLGQKSLEDTQLGSDQPQSLDEHVAAFEKHLTQRDISGKQVRETVTRIHRFVESAGYSSLQQLTAANVESFLADLRLSGLSKQTSNHYLRSIKQFTLWLIRTKRLRENPLIDVKRVNAQTDRRHKRRALSTDELDRLVEAARNGKEIESISGPDRAMMYVLAAWTGFRKGEIGSLTQKSFDFAATPPTVTVEAAFCKAKRRDVQVLHVAVASEVQAWILSKPKLTTSELLFPVSGKVPGGKERKTCKMMRLDLASARKAWLQEATDPVERSRRSQLDFLKYENSQGLFADFHSNRHTFITNLGRTGVSPKTVQQLARHSDIRLTLDVYSHSELAEKAEAVNRLPHPSVRRPSVPPNAGNCQRSKTQLQRRDSAPDAQTGKNGQVLSSDGSQTENDPPSDGSSQVVAKSTLVAAEHVESPNGESTPHWIRTSNLRFRRRINSRRNGH